MKDGRNVAPKVEGEDLVSHRGMPASYFRPSTPFSLYRGTFTRRNEIMKKSALCCRDNTPVDFRRQKKKSLCELSFFFPRTPVLFSLPSFFSLSFSFMIPERIPERTLKGRLYDDEKRRGIFRA